MVRKGKPAKSETEADHVMSDAVEDSAGVHDVNVGEVKVNDAILSDVLIEDKRNGSNASVRNQLKNGGDKHAEVGELKNGSPDIEMAEAEETGDGTPAQQAAFMKEVESFYRDSCLEFKPP